MALEQDLERAHIEEQMKFFDLSKIEYVPIGVTKAHETYAQKSYVASTKRGAKKAHQSRDRERSKHYKEPVRVN